LYSGPRSGLEKSKDSLTAQMLVASGKKP